MSQCEASTDLVGIAVTEHEVGGLNVSMHILMIMDVLQSIELNEEKTVISAVSDTESIQNAASHLSQV